MKKYVYELMYKHGGIVADFVSTVGFFSSLPEVRTHIIEDGSPRENYKAYRHLLNPSTQEQAEAVLVEIKWG